LEKELETLRMMKENGNAVHQTINIYLIKGTDENGNADGKISV